MKILLYKDDGTEFPEDVTEAVKALYDLCIGSMDFRSGFWNAEDAAPVAKLARAAGFEDAEEVEKYVSEALHNEETGAWLRDYKNKLYLSKRYYAGITLTGQDHAHVFSSQGRCMWPGCDQKGFQ